MIRYIKIERAILCLFSLSIFTSKPGIYISSTLFCFYFIFRVATDSEYRIEVKNNKIFLVVLGVFFVGLLSKLISPAKLDDMLYFFYKGMFLLYFPALVLALKDKRNRDLAFFISMSGFAVSAIFSFYQVWMLPHAWQGERFGGLWDVSRWAEITAFVFAFLLPKINMFAEGYKKILITVFLIAVVVSLILSGGRAGWVAVAFSLSLYVLLFNRRLLYFLIPLSIALSLTAYSFIPSQLHSFMNRIQSVSKTSTDDYSNFSRLMMWREGLSLLKYNSENFPLKVFFGVGSKNFESEYVSFLDKKTNIKFLTIKSQGNYSFRDLHNAYLDSTTKMGLVYTLSFYLLLIYMSIFLLSKRGFSGAGCILSFLAIGFFYSNYLEFETVMLFYLIAMDFPFGDVEHS